MPDQPKPTLASWFRLMRIANSPTAISNILMAFLLANGSWNAWPVLSTLIFASVCLYCGGMVLNDVFDVEVDTAERPNRPIPAGEISLPSARLFGFVLLLAGVIFAAIAGLISGQNLRPVLVATSLAACIYLYDAPLKKTVFAPLLMGGCRTLNVFLGASTIDASNLQDRIVLGWPSEVLWIAISIGVLITGVTWLARNETREKNRFEVGMSAAVIVCGLAGIATVVYCPGFVVAKKIGVLFPLLIALLSVTIVRRLITAVSTGRPFDIQACVISIIRSLIIIDAAICYAVAPGAIQYALGVLLLLIPALVLSRWSRVT